MAYLNDALKVVALLVLLYFSLNPLTLALIHSAIEGFDYSQSHLLSLLEEGGYYSFINFEEISYPLAIALSLAIALHVNCHIQVCLYQIHLLVYYANAPQIAWILVENLWNFIYCSIFPFLAAKLTHMLAMRFLTTFCDSSNTGAIAEGFTFYIFLCAFGIVSCYDECRTYELELMAIPSNLDPNSHRTIKQS